MTNHTEYLTGLADKFVILARWFDLQDKQGRFGEFPFDEVQRDIRIAAEALHLRIPLLAEHEEARYMSRRFAPKSYPAFNDAQSAIDNWEKSRDPQAG